MVLRYAHVNVAHAAPSIERMPALGIIKGRKKPAPLKKAASKGKSSRKAA